MEENAFKGVTAPWNGLNRRFFLAELLQSVLDEGPQGESTSDRSLNGAT